MLYDPCMTSLMTVSEARTKLSTLLKKTSENLSRYLITVNNKPKAVLISIDEFESLEETAEVLSVPGAKKSIRQGLRESKAGKGKRLEELLI